MKVRRRFGQHFLEPAWVPKIIHAIRPDASHVFLEIGPGRGALTRALAASGARVIAVEIDRDLAERLASDLPDAVTIVTGDVLEIDLPALIARHRPGPTHLPPAGGTAPALIRLVGNLPYNVASPILFRLLALQRIARPFHDATVMLQREVANRVLAVPGTRDYGPVAIQTRLVADTTKLLALPAGAFRPAPRVTSTLVRLAFRGAAVRLPDPDLFEQMVRRLFQQRRKTLLNALRPFADARGARAEAAIAAAGVDGNRRPETLQLEELAEVAAFFTSLPR